MYYITYNNVLLWERGNPTVGLINPKLTMKVNRVSSLTFTMPTDHPLYGQLEMMLPNVRIYKDYELIFKGRIYDIMKDINGNLNVSVENEMAYLLDTVVAPYNIDGNISDFFTYFLNEHNTRATETQQIQIGECTVTGNGNRWSDYYHNTFDTLTGKLLDTVGGYMYLYYGANEVPILGYYDDGLSVATQRIQYGENLQSYFVDSNAKGFATAVVPLGAIMDGSIRGERITIASVNNGSDSLINNELAQTYGVIYAPTTETTFDELDDPARIKERGLEVLANKIKYADSVTLSAIDLAYIDPNYDKWKLFDKIVFVDRDSEMFSYVLTEMSVSLNDPFNTTITLGSNTLSYIGDTNHRIETTENRVNGLESSMKSVAYNVATETIANNTSILQSAEAIIISALREYAKTSSVEELRESVNTTLSLLANELRLDFNTTTERIQNLDDSTRASFEQIKRYIRFVDGAIVLGTSDSSVKLKIMNDKLFFFAGADNTMSVDSALAYFETDELVVSNITALTHLTIGSFYFQPEANGSMSLVFNG